MSFPGGNSGIARALVKRMLPDAIGGTSTLTDILEAPIRFAALDRDGQGLRIRLASTAVRVEHRNEPAGESVTVTYVQGQRAWRVRARSVVMASGGWVNRRILADAPQSLRTAFGEFNHGPVLVANVALRNWRFLERLGFTSARWFDGFGFFANIRRPMVLGGRSAPFHPDKPTVLTFYVPILKPGHDIRTQGSLARTELFSRSYRDYELALRTQMQRLFSSAGFDQARDIAGIILNRWGHAFLGPQPGFLLGRGGPSPLETVRRGYGRVFFGHSEVAGAQNWPNAASEGARAARQAMDIL
jgi:spermidine dehydrogenase